MAGRSMPDGVAAPTRQPASGGSRLHHHGHGIAVAQGVVGVVVGVVERAVETVGVQVGAHDPRLAQRLLRPLHAGHSQVAVQFPRGPRNGPGNAGRADSVSSQRAVMLETSKSVPWRWTSLVTSTTVSIPSSSIRATMSPGVGEGCHWPRYAASAVSVGRLSPPPTPIAARARRH